MPSSKLSLQDDPLLLRSLPYHIGAFSDPARKEAYQYTTYQIPRDISVSPLSVKGLCFLAFSHKNL